MSKKILISVSYAVADDERGKIPALEIMKSLDNMYTSYGVLPNKFECISVLDISGEIREFEIIGKEWKEVLDGHMLTFEVSEVVLDEEDELFQ